MDLSSPDQRALRDLLLSDLALSHDVTLQVYRVNPATAIAGPELEPVFDVTGDALPVATRARRGSRRDAGADRHRRAACCRSHGRRHRRTAARGGPRARGPGQPAGVVVATDVLTAEMTGRSRRMTEAFAHYSQLRTLKRPLTGVYLSFFLMVTLIILVGALWMGLYLAKRITRPVELLATAAREIGAGRLDQRIEPESDDEFGALTEAFNTMAGELARSQPRCRPVDRGARAAPHGGGGAAPLCRDDSRAHRHWRRVVRRRWAW